MPAPSTVDVWWLDVDACRAAPDELGWLLDPEETQRAGALRRDHDRNRYRQAHIGLRLLMGAYLQLPPAEVTFMRLPCPLCGAAHGRPSVASHRSLHFSLSHSRDLIAYALSASPVGIDVEAPQSGDMPDVVSQFHPAEIAAIGSLPSSRRAAATLQCWVRKEAYLKAIGTGIAGGVATTYAGLGERYEPTGLPPGTPRGWSIVDLEAPHGYAGAFAMSTGASLSAITVHTRTLTLPPGRNASVASPLGRGCY